MSEADKINGLDHSVGVMFHPYHLKGNAVWDFKAMGMAFVDFGEYVMQEGLTIRLPRRGLELNYIPK